MRMHLRAPHRSIALLLLFASIAVIGQAPIQHPERLAGRWEAADGQGGVVGMQLSITTTVPASTLRLTGTEQKLHSIQVAVFRRQLGVPEPPSFNFFDTTPRGGAQWDGTHLQVNLSGWKDVPEIHVALTWNPVADTWSGSFQRASFHQAKITLRPPLRTPLHSFAGCWRHPPASFAENLHIAQLLDGTQTLWSDSLYTPGRTRYANGLQPPKEVLEFYGVIGHVLNKTPRQLTIELHSQTAMCCPHPLALELTPAGTHLHGEWLASPGQFAHKTRWSRELCVAPFQKSATKVQPHAGGGIFLRERRSP